MRSFKNYAKEASKSEDGQGAATAEELTRKIAEAYAGRSNADIFRTILSEAEKSKRAGTLSDDEIDNFYNTFSPMLNSSQKKQLRAVVEKLKEI
jgi:hypothetical protein